MAELSRLHYWVVEDQTDSQRRLRVYILSRARLEVVTQSGLLMASRELGQVRLQLACYGEGDCVSCPSVSDAE